MFFTERRAFQCSIALFYEHIFRGNCGSENWRVQVGDLLPPSHTSHCVPSVGARGLMPDDVKAMLPALAGLPHISRDL